MKIVTINKNKLYEAVNELVSREADRAYNDQGVSLYDGVALKESRDRGIINDYIDDVTDAVCSRLRGYASSGQDEDAGVPSVTFNTESTDDAIERELNRHIVLSVSSKWFAIHYASVAETYSSMAESAFNNLVSLVFLRNKPVRNETDSDTETE